MGAIMKREDQNSMGSTNSVSGSGSVEEAGSGLAGTGTGTAPTDIVSTEIDIPFHQLHVSPRNARTMPHTRQDIECRAASIRAYGLLNRLQVIREPLPGTSKQYGIVAGGGRYLSIKCLVDAGVLPEDYPVKCELRSEADAVAISLAENAHRAPLHEADEFVAFQALVDAGKSVETIASHFGITVRTVQQRLRLAALHPALIAAYRKGEMGPDEVRAFCRSDDLERQLQVWNALPQWSRSAYTIRHHLSQDSVGMDDAMVLFVGLEAYRAAGGTVATDLFSLETDQGRVDNLALLHQLAVEKLQAIAADIVEKEGWAWSDVVETFSHQHRAQFTQVEPARRAPTVAEEAAIGRLRAERGDRTARRDALEASLGQLDEDGDDAGCGNEGAGGAGDAAHEVDCASEQGIEQQIGALYQQIAALDATLREIEESLVAYADDVRAHAGVVVALDGRGGVQVVRGLTRRDGTEPGGAAGVAAAGGSETGSGATSKPRKERAEVSERLAFQLSAHRTAVMQAAMIDRPDVALAAATHRLLEAVTRRHRYGDSDPLKITGIVSLGSLHEKASDLKNARASDEVQARIDVWRLRIPQDAADEFAWLLSLAPAESLELFALCVALSLDATTGVAGRQPGLELAGALQIDVADYWTATEASYLGSVPKEKMAEAVEEACGPGSGVPILKMKKAEAAQYAEQKLAGSRWLPSMLRAPVASDADDDAGVARQAGAGREIPEASAVVADAADVIALTDAGGTGMAVRADAAGSVTPVPAHVIS
jgi:ParB family chromosome partitioning protein